MEVHRYECRHQLMTLL